MEQHRSSSEKLADRWKLVAARFDQYLHTRRGLSTNTLRNYLTDLLPFWRFLEIHEIQNLNDLDRPLVRSYLYWLLTEARPIGRTHRRRAGYAAQSVSRKLSVLRTLFNFLSQEGTVSSNPVSRIASAKTEQRLPQFLDLHSVRTLLDAPPTTTLIGIRDRAILELLYASGARVSELTGLNVDDLDLDRNQAKVFGKGSRERIILLGDPAKVAIVEYLSHARSQIRRNRIAGNALFLSRHGGRLTQRSIQRLVHYYGEQAQLAPSVHPHTLRHTFATHLLDGGADIRVVQELLGHASAATTQIYTHVTQEAAQRIYQTAHPRSSKKTEPTA